MAWLKVKNQDEDQKQAISYDEVPFWDFLVTRLRLFVIENRDVISVSLILIMGFAVLWTVRTSRQPVSTRSQAAGEEMSVTPTPIVTILVVTPTPSLSPTLSPLPTLPLQPVLTSIPSISPAGLHPTNPFWEYLK